MSFSVCNLIEVYIWMVVGLGCLHSKAHKQPNITIYFLFNFQLT